MLDAVKNVRKVTWILLRNAAVQSLTDGTLTLRFTREGDVKGFLGSGCDTDLQRVLAESFGLKVQVKAVAGAAPPASGVAQAVRNNETSSRTVATETPPPPAEPAVTNEPPPPPPPPDLPPPPQASYDAGEGDPFDHTDPDASAGEADLTGMDLIRRELGGRIIDEIDNT